MNDYGEYVKYISDILEIETPSVKTLSFDEMMSLSESPAFYDIQNKVVYLADKDSYEMNDFFILAYTLRIVWQDITNHEYYFPDYDTNKSNHELNISPSEIDARAFATVAIAISFSKKTTIKFRNDPEAQQLYDKRLDELCEEFGVDFLIIE